MNRTSIFEQPSEEQLIAFIDGDPVAINQVMRLIIPQLHRWAIKQYSNLPSDEVQSIIHQVLAETCLHHGRYDINEVKFTTYIINLVKRRMVDLHERHNNIILFEDYSVDAREKLERQSYNHSDDLSLETRIIRAQFFAGIQERLDATEREFIELMRKGEKDNDVYVATLSRHGVSVKQIHEVKNTKARIMRKLQTFAQDMGYSLEDLFET